MFNDVEGEIVKTAERPDGQREQQTDFERGQLQNKKGRCRGTDEQKSNRFKFNPARVGEVFHKSKHH